MGNENVIPQRRRSSANNSSGSNSNSGINSIIHDTMSNATSNITGDSACNPSLSPAAPIVHHTNSNVTSKQRKSDEVSMGNSPMTSCDDQLQRIKDEIAERQRMVEQLEKMEPKQKRPKIEIGI